MFSKKSLVRSFTQFHTLICVMYTVTLFMYSIVRIVYDVSAEISDYEDGTYIFILAAMAGICYLILKWCKAVNRTVRHFIFLWPECPTCQELFRVFTGKTEAEPLEDCQITDKERRFDVLIVLIPAGIISSITIFAPNAIARFADRLFWPAEAVVTITICLIFMANYVCEQFVD